ncbi:MAG: cation transporter [Desulfobacteraceae bacterium]|nr:cation transporter [Desulfobacteraceae bacterium]
MKKLTQFIISKLIKNHEQINLPDVRAGYGMLEGWLSFVINTVLFFIKIIIGIKFHSTALIADAIHTLGDSATSIIVIMGFKIAKKPSDSEHPFGHGKMEAVATLVVSVLLFIAGFETMKQSLTCIFNPTKSSVNIYVFIIITGTIIIKELLARFSYELGEIIDSDTLKADALHHRTDVYATILVIVAMIASEFGFDYIDGIMGGMISIIIFYSAFSIARNAINPLLGEAPSQEMLKEIEAVATSANGVSGVHDIIIHQYGKTVIVSMHIEVSDKLSASESHDIAETVEELIEKKTGGVVVIHVDPINKNHPQYRSVATFVESIISKDKRIESFHDLRIIGENIDSCNVVFDLSLSFNLKETEFKGIINHIRSEFKLTFPEMKLIIKIDPQFSYTRC